MADSVVNLFSSSDDIPADIQFRFIRYPDGIAVILSDRSLSKDHPLFMCKLAAASFGQLLELINMQPGTTLDVSGMNWSDYQAYRSTGELPPGHIP